MAAGSFLPFSQRAAFQTLQGRGFSASLCHTLSGLPVTALHAGCRPLLHCTPHPTYTHFPSPRSSVCCHSCWVTLLCGDPPSSPSASHGEHRLVTLTLSSLCAAMSVWAAGKLSISHLPKPPPPSLCPGTAQVCPCRDPAHTANGPPAVCRELGASRPFSWRPLGWADSLWAEHWQ